MLDFSHPEFQARFDPPDGMLKTVLKDYQRAHIAWMIRREKNAIKGCRGGILANEPGLGKTLMCLATMLAHPVPKTLVVVPANIIDNWIAEMRKHTNIPVEKEVLVYYGTNRQPLLEKVRQTAIRIVITTYGTLLSDTKRSKEGGPFLLQNVFGRVIWDEAHALKNRNKTFTTMMSVVAQRRWIVSATPVMNYPKEMFSYLTLLKFNIDHKKFNMKHEPDLNQLQKLVFPICMMCLKKDVLDIPQKHYNEFAVEFNTVEREFYEALKSYSKVRIGRLLKLYNNAINAKTKNGLRLKTYSDIFLLILRLRQACDSPLLAIENTDRFGAMTISEASQALRYYSTPKALSKECGLCSSAAATLKIECGNQVCARCFEAIRGGCLFCDRPHPESRTMPIKVRSPKRKRATEGDGSSGAYWSSKIEAFFKNHLPQIIRSGEKVMVISQFLGMLDQLTARFQKEYPHLKFVRIDGSVPPRKRDMFLNEFRERTDCPVCFISFASSLEGLNIVEARRVIFFERYWNSKKELQLIDRTHRIGQNKTVQILNYYVRDSIEEKISQLIALKDDQIDVFFGQRNSCAGGDWLSRTVKLVE